MKALILAAGEGTRLKPITDYMPKTMIPIINRPIIEIIVDLLRRHGVRKILINTSHFATEIESYFRDGARFGVEIAYSFEGRYENGRLVAEPVGSAGALKKIQENSGFFNKTFLVICGDAIIDLDITELLHIHREKNSLATIALTQISPEKLYRYGVVATDQNKRIIEFQEKPPLESAKSNIINTGIYVFEPEVIKWIPSGVSYDIGSHLIPDLITQGAEIYGIEIPFQWLDIGNVSDYYEVMQMALRGQVNGISMPGEEIAEGIWVGLNVNLNLSKCEFIPPLYIGGSSSIKNSCTIIGPTMIGSGCLIQSAAYIENSVILDYTRIGKGSHIKDMIVYRDYCITSSGELVKQNRSITKLITADARSTKKTLI